MAGERGQLGGQLVMVQVDVTDDLAEGDPVVTAGLELAQGAARSPYPKGLLIGDVQAVQQDANALTQTGFVRPALDFDSLERLLVVTDYRQD